MKVRILSFLLTLCMVLTLVPAVAFAETTAVSATEVSSTDAFKAALASGAQSVKLTGDVTFVGTIAHDVKIDLNGNKLSGTIIPDGTVTVVDNGKGTIDTDVVKGEGTLVIESAGKVADKLISYVSNTSTIKAADAGFSKVAVATAEQIPYQVGNKKYVRWADAINSATNPVVTVIQHVLFTETVTKSVTVEVDTRGNFVFNAPTLDVATGATITFTSGKVQIGAVSGAGKVVMGEKVGAGVSMDQKTAPTGANADNFVINGGLYAFNAIPFLAAGLTQVNNLVVKDVADYVAYVGVEGYTLATLEEAVKQAGASGNPIILVDSLDKVINIPEGYAVTIELNGCTVTSVIENNGTLIITDTLGSGVGTAEQIINNGSLTLKGGFAVRVENHTKTSTTTLDGAKLSIFDNYSEAANALLIKNGFASEAVYNTYTARKYFYENAGFAAPVNGYAEVIKYAAFVGEVGYLEADVKAAIEAITGTATVTLYKSVDTVTVNGNVTFVLKDNATLANVTIATGKTLTVPYGDTEYTYGEGFYETISKPVCYIVVNNENVYFTSMQAAIDAVVPGTKTTITVVDDFAGKGVNIETAIEVVIDLAGKTYTINDLIGANGTIGFRIHNNEAKVTIQNGTLAVAEDAVNHGASGNNYLINNFGKALTLTNVNLVGSKKTTIVLCNNYGTVTLDGTTSVTASAAEYIGVVSQNWSTYTGLDIAAGTAVTIDTTGTIGGTLMIDTDAGDNTVASFTLKNGTFTGAFVAESGAPAAFAISGGTYTGLTYEEFYGYIGENIAHINEDGSLTINNENVYEAEYNGVKYLTVAAAIAKAANKGTVYLLVDFVDLTVENDQMVKLEVGNNVVVNFTKTGAGELKIMSGTVVGTLTVSEGLVTVYSAKQTFVLGDIVVAEDADLQITTGIWYVEEMKEILPYVPAKYFVNAAVDEDEVTYYTVEATNPEVAIINAAGEQILRVDTLVNALDMIFAEDSDYADCGIEIINGDSYSIDLEPGQSVTIINTVNADITVAFEGELEQVTLVEGNVYTGYTAVAKVLYQGVYYSFKTVAEAVAYADGNEWEVTTYEDVDETFTVEEFALINGEFYGVGEYAGLEEFDAIIYRADSDTTTRYATLADAVSAAYDGERIDVVRDITIDNVIDLDGKTITIYAGTSAAKFNLGNVKVEGTGAVAFYYASIKKLESTSGATCDASYNANVEEIVWENGVIGVRGDAAKVTVKNATVKLSHSALIGELNLEGAIVLQAVSAHTVKALTLTDVTFGANSSLAIGNYYGLTDATFAALDTIVKEGYVLNKAVDADDVIYYEVVNAADFVAIVDGFYFADIYRAIDFAAGEEVVTLIKAVNVVLANNTTVVVAAESLELLTITTANSSYYLAVVETEANTTYTSKYIMAQVGDKYYASVNDAIADGNTTIQVFGKDTFTVESGYVMLWTSSANICTVYGEGTFTTLGATTVIAQDAAYKTYKFADLQTAIDFAVANELALTFSEITEDQKATIAEGTFKFHIAIDSVIDLTIVDGAVELVSGKFTGDVDKAFINAVATSTNVDVVTVYSAVYEINYDQPSNINVLADLDGLVIAVDTYLANNYFYAYAITNLEVVGDAVLTVDGLLDVYTAGLEIADTATLLIASTAVMFDADIYTGKANVLAAVMCTDADTWLFSNVYDEWYGLVSSAVGFNNKGYANLTDALTAAKKADGVITLYENQAFTKTLALKDVYIDLNGYTITVVDVTVSGEVTLENGTIDVTKTSSKQSYAIKVNADATLELNDMTVEAGDFFDNYTGKKVAIQLENSATLTGYNIDLVEEAAKVGGINVFADPQKPATLNVDGEIDFVNAIYYKFSNKASLICVNHAMTDNHDCAYCGEKAVKVVLGGDATIIGAEADENGAYWFFAGEKVTLKHGTVEPGKHFARWTVEGGASYINADVDMNELVIVAGESRYAYVEAVFEANNAVTVQISAPYFNVTGLTSAQIGNVVITASAGAKITVTYTDPTNGLFGDILYWINDNGAIIGTNNVLEYTVPTTGGTITAICSSAVAGQDITVVFQNGTAKIGAKVLNYAKYTAADLANLFVPALPALGSQNVIGWSLDGTTALENPAEIVAAIEAAIAAGKSKIVFVPAIEVPEFVTVNVEVNGDIVDTYEVNPTVYSVIKTTYDKEGMVLSHWVVNDKIEIYADELVYKFATDMTVEAVFVEEIYGVSRDIIVDFAGGYANSEKVVFEAVYQLPDGYTMTDAGIIYTTDENVDDDEIVINSNGNVKVKHVTGLDGNKTATYTLTLNFKNGFKNVRARAFVSFVDADGNTYVIYSVGVISADELLGE